MSEGSLVYTEKKTAALFSGRFDPPNLGHVITVGWLLRKYRQVIIAILDYPEREACGVIDAMHMFRTCFSLLRPNSLDSITLLIDDIHFGKIKLDRIKFLCRSVFIKFGDVVYVGGNESVNKHIKSLGLPVDVLPRVKLQGDYGEIGEYLYDDQYVFESTRIREKIKKGQPLGIQYNIDIKDKH